MVLIIRIEIINCFQEPDCREDDSRDKGIGELTDGIGALLEVVLSIKQEGTTNILTNSLTDEKNIIALRWPDETKSFQSIYI